MCPMHAFMSGGFRVGQAYNTLLPTGCPPDASTGVIFVHCNCYLMYTGCSIKKIQSVF